MLGLCVGLARLSKHQLVALWARCYIDLFRNMPILLRLMFWYIILLHMHMPNARRRFFFGQAAFCRTAASVSPGPVSGFSSATGWWLSLAGGLAAIAFPLARLPFWRQSTSGSGRPRAASLGQSTTELTNKKNLIHQISNPRMMMMITIRQARTFPTRHHASVEVPGDVRTLYILRDRAALMPAAPLPEGVGAQTALA